MRAKNRRIEAPDREILGRKYQAGSCRTLATEYGVSSSTIFKWLRQYGIPRHGGNGRWALKWERCRGCGTDERPHKALGYCERCYRRLIHYPREKRGETSGQPLYQFNPKTLAERYWKDGLSHGALAKQYGISEGTIRRCFIRYGIASRPRGGARFVRGRDGWAKTHDRCIECGSSDIPHRAQGLCQSCYDGKRRPRTAKRKPVVCRSEHQPSSHIPVLAREPSFICPRCGYEHYD